MIEIYHSNKLIAELNKDGYKYFLHYLNNVSLQDSISLRMPTNHKFYINEHYLHPYFEMYLPEGYLFEIFKNIIAKKYGEVNDFLIFSLLANNIEGRINFKSKNDKKVFMPIDIEEILNYDSEDTFKNILDRFLEKNALSGIQPKSIAVVKDKKNIETKEYIVKTWGSEYPYLAENEYFCMRALKKAGIEIPNIKLSKNKKFLLVEKFTYDKNNNEFLGFEEVLVLLEKNRVSKYQGSYEQVTKAILDFSTQVEYSSKQLYKTIIMNYLLKNGDAHLKNFGIVYRDDFSDIRISPAYDVVNTVAYIYKDKPALMLKGKKIWYGKNELIDFGEKYCKLSHKEALDMYNECIEALNMSINELREYIKENPHFKEIGNRILNIWNFSLKHHNQNFKELPSEIITDRRNDKKIAQRKRLHARRVL